MINFECAFDENFVFEKAQKLFKNCEYWSFVIYITDKIELFSSDNKQTLCYAWQDICDMGVL